MRKWLQAVRQTTAYLGVAVLVIIWGGIYLASIEAHNRAFEEARRHGSDLSLALAEYTRRVVQETDHSLLALRRAYRIDPRQFDIAKWAARAGLPNQMTVGFGIVGPDGFLRETSRGPLTSPIYLGGRNGFKSQMTDRVDRLYISVPAIGHASGKFVIEFTRRLSKPDGSFDGIVAASLSVAQIDRFFSSLGAGHGGLISLVGLDGIVRASGGLDAGLGRLAGASIMHSMLFSRMRRSSVGHYWSIAGSAFSDGAIRLISYRTIPGLPLVAVVGLAKQPIFAEADASLRKYIFAGAALTSIVLVLMALGAAGQAQILAGKKSLEQTNLWLHTAFANMAHGVCMFDRDQRLVVCNDRYCQMYGLCPEQIKPGNTLRSVLEARVSAGVSPENAENYIQTRLAEVTAGLPCDSENELNDGRIYLVNHRPMRDGGWVAIHQDITGQKKVERALLESTEALKNANARFAAALQNMSQGLCMVDGAQKILVANERYRQIYDLPERLTKPGTALQDVFAYRCVSGNYVGPARVDYLAAQQTNSSDIEKLGNGRVVFILRHSMADGCWLTTHEDITERWRNESRISFMAHHDALTGLTNRAALIEKIEDACARNRRWGHAFAVLLIDLDRFKQVNDTFGHPTGDELLKQVAQRIKGLLQNTDVLARLGGDEFAIVQASDDARGDAVADLAMRIIRVIGEPFSINGHVVNIGTSIGIALAPEHGLHADDLMKMTDLALYHAKSRGRNRYAIFEPELGQAALAKHVLESELRRALAKNQLEVNFQPIADARSLKAVSAEALVRWRHPERGLIAPDQFIPLAEETGTVLEIGEWVLHAACREAANWPAPVKVAVNISAVQLRSQSLLDYVMCVLVDTGLPPERLELEITETALIENGTECLALLTKLKNMGITVALDDFGTGYSSLNQLTMFPFDKIKIDKSFTKYVTKRSDCAAIVSAVLALARGLDIQTTAEGVEKADQLRLLRLAGVSSLQGYLIQRPCAASELRFDVPLIQGELEDAA